MELILGVSAAILAVLCITLFVDMPFTFCTIFDVVRNQYFFLEDGLITSIPQAMNFVVSTYVMVELTEPGTEGNNDSLFCRDINFDNAWVAGKLLGPSSACTCNAASNAASSREIG